MLKYKNNEYLLLASCTVLLLIFACDFRSTFAFFAVLIVCVAILLTAWYATRKELKP